MKSVILTASMASILVTATAFASGTMHSKAEIEQAKDKIFFNIVRRLPKERFFPSTQHAITMAESLSLDAARHSIPEERNILPAQFRPNVDLVLPNREFTDEEFKKVINTLHALKASMVYMSFYADAKPGLDSITPEHVYQKGHSVSLLELIGLNGAASVPISARDKIFFILPHYDHFVLNFTKRLQGTDEQSLVKKSKSLDTVLSDYPRGTPDSKRSTYEEIYFKPTISMDSTLYFNGALDQDVLTMTTAMIVIALEDTNFSTLAMKVGKDIVAMGIVAAAIAAGGSDPEMVNLVFGW